MPPLPSVNHVADIRLGQEYDEDSGILNRFFIGWGSGTLTGGDANTWATAVATSWAAHMAGDIKTDLALTSVILTDLTSPSAAIGTWFGSHAGAVSDSVDPASVTMRLGFKVGRRYRGGHPGVYISGIQSGYFNDAQTWTDGGVTAMVSKWEAFIGDVIANAPVALAGLFHANVSYYSGFTVVTNPSTGRARNVPTVRVAPVVDPIVGIHADKHYAAQRRRNQLD